MKAVILAGGKGTRLLEKTKVIPKPMIKIGNKPIIWHIIKLLSAQGIDDFIICSGYKSNIIEQFFKNKKNIKVINTGLKTQTAKRISMIKEYVKEDSNFLMTYGDGLANINLKDLIDLHLKKKKLATVTAVLPPARFGSIIIKNNLVKSFDEKPTNYKNVINGGFFILNKKIFRALNLGKRDEMWEQSPMKRLTKISQLAVYTHKDFWHPMDTLRDNIHLNKLWKNNTAPWKIW
tara:strand:- start:3218 stop:3919 length:702 start_codon:yes stop_codon:yes gene_type:complete